MLLTGTVQVDLSTIIFVAAIGVFTLVAALCDLWTKRLPNALTVTGLATAIGYHVLTGAIDRGWAGAGSGLLFSLGGFTTGFGILLVLWLIGGGGGGDVKLMGALGAWLGATLTLNVFLVSSFFVAVGSVSILVLQMLRRGYSYVHRRYLSTAQITPSGSKRKREAEKLERAWRLRRRVLPYAVPVALSTWVVLAWKVLFVFGV